MNIKTWLFTGIKFQMISPFSNLNIRYKVHKDFTMYYTVHVVYFYYGHVKKLYPFIFSKIYNYM